MPEITASLVKTLREKTDVPMMDCKRALVEANGDMDAAVEILRKKGQAKAGAKSDRVTAEGMIAAACSADGKQGVLLDVNCETDFVSRSDDFKNFATAAAKAALDNQCKEIDALMAASLSASETVDEIRKNLISKLGENIQVRRIAWLTSEGIVSSYIHGGRIGVLVALTTANESLAKDLAMHIAASNPLVVNPSEVSEELVAKEKEIYAAQALTSGKPADIVEKMIAGRVKKYLDEISLMGQPFVKDPDTTVGQLLSKNQASVSGFIRFSVGEGIEKKVDNFVEEVMAQARGA